MNSLKNLISLCLIFSCLFPTSTTAQNCLNFESLLGGYYYNGNNYNPGDILFTENDVVAHIDQFYYLSGGSDMWGVTVDTSSLASLPISGNSLWISNATTKFDFSNLNDPVNSLQFDYWDGGGEINFAINDQNVYKVNHLTDLPSNIAPGVSLLVDHTGIHQGSVYLQGSITSLLIGGQEFLFDNLCTSNNMLDCHITEVVATPQDCTPNGIFYVDLEFAHIGMVSDSFEVIGNGSQYGTFAYGMDSYNIGPLLGDGNTVYEFIIVDLNNPNCQAYTEIDALDCSNQQDCQIFEFFAEAHEVCNDDGTFNIDLQFEIENGLGAGFDLYVNNEFHSYHQGYPDPFITIEALAFGSGQTILLTVKDNDNPDCQASFTLLAPNCNANNDCHIAEVIATAQDCDPNNIFFVDISFEYSGMVSDSFKIVGNGNQYGTFAYGMDTYTVGPILGDGNTEYEFIIIDLANPECQAFTFIDPIDCNNNSDCQIFEFFAEAYEECNDDGTFNIDLQFIIENGLGAGFDLYVNNEFHSYHQDYPNPFTTINAIALGNGQTILLTVKDNDNPDCQASFTLIAPDCNNNNDCELSEVQATAVCDGDSYYVNFDFEYQNTSDLFYIQIGGINAGPFSYSLLPFDWGPIPSGNNNTINFVIFDAADESCLTTGSFTEPDCQSNDCNLSNLQVYEINCLNDGTYTALIDFDYSNTGGLGFDVWSDDTYLGFYNYEALPISITSSGDYIDEITVCDNDNEDCCVSYMFDLPCGNNCVGFDYIPWEVIGNSTGNMPGSTLTNEDVHVTLQNYENSDGSTAYFDLFIGDDILGNSFSLTDNQYVLASNINLKFDFTVLSYAVNSIDLIFYDGGGNENISVNGNPIIVVSEFTDLPTEIAPSITASVNLDPNNAQMGTLSISGGNITSLIIGGQELAIDNVCFNQSTLTGDVWPGDANADNIANHFDLLNIGIAFNSQGESRIEQDIQWFAHPAEDWTDSFEDGTNFKNADTNGDGSVDLLDRNAILENYNLTHGTVEDFIPIQGTPNDPPFFVDLPTDGIPLGQDFEAPIILGEDSNPINDIYGIAYTIKFDPVVINPNSVQVIYDGSWLGEASGNPISVDKTYANDGLIEVAMSRTDNENIDGFGSLAILKGVIEDDILGKTEMEVEIINVKAIMYNEMQIPLYQPVVIVDMENKITEVKDLSLKQQLKLSPNPTSGIFRIINLSDEQIERISIYDTIGKLIHSQDQDFDRLSLADYPAGIYSIQIEVNGEIIHKRLIKQ